MTLFGAVLAFLFFLPFSFPELIFITITAYVFGHSRAISTRNVQTHQKTSYDSKTCWVAIRCVIWRSLTFILVWGEHAHTEKSVCVCVRKIGHTPSTAGTFRRRFQKDSGKTSETLSELFLESPREYGWDTPSPIIQGI